MGTADWRQLLPGGGYLKRSDDWVKWTPAVTVSSSGCSGCFLIIVHERCVCNKLIPAAKAHMSRAASKTTRYLELVTAVRQMFNAHNLAFIVCYYLYMHVATVFLAGLYLLQV